MSESGQTTTSLVWKADTDYALGVYRLIGHSLGIWPQTCDNFSSKVKFLVVFLLQIHLNYSLIQEFVNGCVSDFNVDFIGVLVTTTVSLLKITLIRVQWKSMNLMVESAANDWWVVGDDNSRKIMRKNAYFARFVSMFQLISTYASAIVIILAAPPTFGLATNDPDIPVSNFSIPTLRNIPMGSGCSVIDFPSHLYLAFYIFQFIQLIILCTCTTGCDAIFFGLTMHLCAQLELLNINIAQFGHDPKRKNVKADFVALVDRHNHLTRLVDLMEDIFHRIILGQLAASIIHISLLGIKVLYGLQDGDYVTLIYSSIAITSLLRQIFICSYAGDYLVTQTSAIRGAAYNSCWYNLSPSLAKDVMFVMVRSNSPFHLTAGKLIRMNIESFTTLMKTMISFFSVLKLTIIS